MRRAVALGTFDGVHAGHREVVRTVIARARALDARAAVATFHPRPVAVLAPERAPDSLVTLARRIELLSEAGAEDVVVLEFTPAFAALGPEEFVDRVLIGDLGAVEVVVGGNFRFGRGRAGDVDLLRTLAETRGFGVTIAPLHEIDGAPVSSSRIRDLVRAGDVEGATRLLGRPPSVEGVVERGDGRGRGLGVPTANLALAPGLVCPAEGVYAGDAVLGDGRRFRAAISVGTNPTFAGVETLRVEAHLLRFDEAIYGAALRVEFRRYLRGQLRFEDVDELVRQMRVDIAAADG
jgi:riboflavin kinase / FMN adenylyltransferase